MAEVRVAPLEPGPDAGAPVRVRVGDVLAVELPENATTGWVWSVDAVPGQLLVLDAEPGVVPGAARGERPGAGGARVVRLAVRAEGAGELRLRHARRWQPERGDVLTVLVQADAAS